MEAGYFPLPVFSIKEFEKIIFVDMIHSVDKRTTVVVNNFNTHHETGFRQHGQSALLPLAAIAAAAAAAVVGGVGVVGNGRVVFGTGAIQQDMALQRELFQAGQPSQCTCHLRVGGVGGEWGECRKKVCQSN